MTLPVSADAYYDTSFFSSFILTSQGGLRLHFEYHNLWFDLISTYVSLIRIKRGVRLLYDELLGKLQNSEWFKRIFISFTFRL